MSTYNRLDLQTLGSQPIMPKNLPDHCSKWSMKFSFGSSLQTGHLEEQSLQRSPSLTYMFWPFLTLMFPHQACTWRKEWIWGTSENFPRSKHLNAPILSKWGNTNSTMLRTLNLQEKMLDWMLLKVKPSSVFTKQTPYSQCYLSVKVATLQPFNGLKNDPNLFVLGLPQLLVCPDHLAPTTLVHLLNSYALPLLWHQFV